MSNSVTPWTVARQAPQSMGFSRQEYWSGLPFLLQCMKVKRESEVVQSCLTLSDPMDCSPPGSSVHGIFQARVLEWGATCVLSVSFIKTKLHKERHSLCLPLNIEQCLVYSRCIINICWIKA